MWLITGGTGFVGQALLRRLLTHESWADQSFVVLVRDVRKWDLLWLELAPHVRAKVHVVRGDLHHLEELRPFASGICGVIHLAAQLFAHRKRDFAHTNREGTEQLHRFLQVHGSKENVRWIYLSSIAANGPTSLTVDGRSPMIDQNRPISWYGQSKREAEQYLCTHHGREHVVIVRPGMVFGPGDKAWLPFWRFMQMGFTPSWQGKIIPYYSMIDVAYLVLAIDALMKVRDSIPYSIYPTFWEPLHWDQIIGMWRSFLPYSWSIRVPISFGGLHIASHVIKSVGRWKMSHRWGWAANGDKLTEMAACHWVKDGGKQMEDLGISVPRWGMWEWQRCLQEWQRSDWHQLSSR